MFKRVVASAGLLFMPVASAMAATAVRLQDPIKVEVSSTGSRTVWYTDPMWLAIGGLVVVLIIVLAVMAARGRDTGTSTTVVR